MSLPATRGGLPRVRPALAYRWASEQAVLQLCNCDRLPASWRHRIPWLDQDVVGVSLSRNPCYEQAAPVRLCLDLEALRARYRILPLSADYVFDLARIGRGERQADPTQCYDRAARLDPYMPSSHPFERDRADEEFVVGGIDRVSRYLRRVELRPGASSELRLSLQAYAEAHQPFGADFPSRPVTPP